MQYMYVPVTTLCPVQAGEPGNLEVRDSVPTNDTLNMDYDFRTNKCSIVNI